MRDKVALHINNQKIEDFISYRIEANLFSAADAFELTLADRNVKVKAGDTCQLYVNGGLELSGIVDAAPKSFDKSGVTLTVRGRDFMGLLADTYAEEFITLKDYTLKELAEKLLTPISYINRKKIQYGEGNKNRAVPLTETEEDFEYTQIDPARTVFEMLKEYALSRGMLFFSLPDGTLVFGQPRTSGKAEYTLIHKKKGQNNNVLSGEKTDDISRRYSKVTIMGQRQGTDSWETEDINVSAGLEDDDYPFYKPFVGTTEYDGQNPEKYARILMDKQRFQGWTLSYKVPGHSLNNRNYTINAVCRVEDEILEISGDFLIYERVLEMSRQGVFTSLKLSHLGVLPA
jgi:prophage tail gpP-like protein